LHLSENEFNKYLNQQLDYENLLNFNEIEIVELEIIYRKSSLNIFSNADYVGNLVTKIFY